MWQSCCWTSVADACACTFLQELERRAAAAAAPGLPSASLSLLPAAERRFRAAAALASGDAQSARACALRSLAYHAPCLSLHILPAAAALVPVETLLDMHLRSHI